MNNCVASGPFVNRTEHVGPLEEATDYCFARRFNQTKGLSYGARSNVDACYEYGGSEFDAFYEYMALYPHIARHQAVSRIRSDRILKRSVLLTQYLDDRC